MPLLRKAIENPLESACDDLAYSLIAKQQSLMPEANERWADYNNETLLTVIQKTGEIITVIIGGHSFEGDNRI